MFKTYRNMPVPSRPLCSCLALIIMCGFAMPMLAQFTTARLNGTVVDASGAALARAVVTVAQVGTGFTRTTSTGNSGEYLFPALPVGQYQITVTLNGFNTYMQQGITLSTNEAVTVPVKMAVGAVAQKVTVTANATMVTTDSATLGQVIGQKDIVGLP